MYTEHDDLIDSLKGNLIRVTKQGLYEYLDKAYFEYLCERLHDDESLDELFDIREKHSDTWWKRYKYPQDGNVSPMSSLFEHYVKFGSYPPGKIASKSDIGRWKQAFKMIDMLELVCKDISEHDDIDIQINIRKLDE